MKTKSEAQLEAQYSQDIEFAYKQRKDIEAKSKYLAGRKICLISVILIIIMPFLGAAVWRAGLSSYFSNERRMG